MKSKARAPPTSPTYPSSSPTYPSSIPTYLSSSPTWAPALPELQPYLAELYLLFPVCARLHVYSSLLATSYLLFDVYYSPLFNRLKHDYSCYKATFTLGYHHFIYLLGVCNSRKAAAQFGYHWSMPSRWKILSLCSRLCMKSNHQLGSSLKPRRCVKGWYRRGYRSGYRRGYRRGYRVSVNVAS